MKHPVRVDKILAAIQEIHQKETLAAGEGCRREPPTADRVGEPRRSRGRLRGADDEPDRGAIVGVHERPLAIMREGLGKAGRIDFSPATGAAWDRGSRFKSRVGKDVLGHDRTHRGYYSTDRHGKAKSK